MKRLQIFILVAVTGVTTTFAQQQPMFTQYMYNGLLINPATAGNKMAVEFNALYRKQYVGFEGAPKTQSFSVSSPIRSKNIGLGLKVMNETLGPAVTMNSIGLCYAYQIHFDNSRLSLGVEANMLNQSIDFPSLRRTDPNDKAIPSKKESVFIPDATTGVFFDKETFFAGLTAANLFSNKYQYKGINNRSLTGNLSRHYYLYTGAIFKLSDKFKITPAILGKYVSGAPMQIDINAIGVYNEMLSLGLGYRTDRSMSGIFRVTVQRVSIGYSYDFTTSQMGQYHSGNHEIILSYKITFPDPPGKRVVHPRYYF
ncbi:MAG: type IX secretion system membrane protein PorP/SprF [Bacteroidia bacterium]|nr:type IX secretion system membrane protein PorP/SprF [Bacteroidia bacterium]